MSFLIHAFETADIETSHVHAIEMGSRAVKPSEPKPASASCETANRQSLAPVIGRYVGAIVGGALLAAAMIGPLSALPGSHVNVYSGLSFLLALAWFVALNYVRKPLLAAGFIVLGVFGVTAATLSLASPGWLWAMWGVNALAGLAGLMFSYRWTVVPADRITAWTVYHLALMAMVGLA